MCHSPGCKGTNTSLFLVPGSHHEPQTPHVLPWAPRQRQVTRRTGDSPAPWCLPTSTSAPAMQPIPRMQTTMPMKCTALYRVNRKNQESKITTGITKQSRSYGREGGKQQSGDQRAAEKWLLSAERTFPLKLSFGEDPEVRQLKQTLKQMTWTLLKPKPWRKGEKANQ